MRRIYFSIIILLLTISSFAQNAWLTYTTEDGLVNNSVKALDIDNEGNIWIGTESGVSMFNGGNFTNYTTADGLANNSVLSVFVDSQDNIWFGTYGGGVSKFDGTTWTTYSTDEGLASAIVYSIYEDVNNTMWFGTISGVSVFDGTTWTTYDNTNGLSSNIVSSICQDAQDNIWIGLWTSGISVFDGTNWIDIDEEDELVHNQVTNIFRDNNDKMWVGTADGISVFSDTATWIESFMEDDGIIDDWVEGIDEDSQGNLWFSFYTNYMNNGGASFYDGSTWINYTIDDGLANSEVTDVLVKEDDNIWFATSLGLTNFYLSTGVEDLNNSNEIVNIYPNPAEDKLTINANNVNIVSIVITDVSGKPVFKQINSNNSINVSELAAGIYFVNLYTDSNIIIKKLLKN